MGESAVAFRGVTKRFPGVLALDGVSVDIAAGSCHALCGENGAGKSTLGKVLAGIHQPDEGSLVLWGRPVDFSSPRAALLAGVGMVHQELAFCGNLSVAENLCLGALPSRRGVLLRSELCDRASALLTEIGVRMDVRRPIAELSLAQQQMVQIAAAVGGGARIIVFDEPTSSLSHVETERLYELIGRLKGRGVTCIYVSHRMPEIFRLCDAATVLRDGRHVDTRPVAELSESELVRLMLGRALEAQRDRAPRSTRKEVRRSDSGDELLRVTDLSSPGKFEHVSFSLRASEVVGLAGLVGAGRSELAHALFGLDRTVRGRVHLNGRPVRIRSPREAIRLGIGLVPEDRKKHGLVLSESVLHNISLPILRMLSRYRWLQREREHGLAADYAGRLRVRTAGLSALVAGLSGGNQQKVVLAKWLAARSRLLILDEPTRGVDVGAKAEIQELIDQLAAQGHAVLLISSELSEILRLSHRVLVLRGGRVVGEVPGEDATEDGLLRLMAGLPTGEP